MKGGLTFFNSPQIVMEFIFKCLCPLERFQLRSINTLSRRWILYDGSLNVSLWLVFAVKENADAQKALKRLDIDNDTWEDLSFKDISEFERPKKESHYHPVLKSHESLYKHDEGNGWIKINSVYDNEIPAHVFLKGFRSRFLWFWECSNP